METIERDVLPVSFSVRTSPSMDKNPKPNLFVELKPDHWYEVEELPTFDMCLSWFKKDRAIHIKIASGKLRRYRVPISIATRAFGIFVKNWQELKPITKA